MAALADGDEAYAVRETRSAEAAIGQQAVQALPQGLRPRAVLADLQLVYWPASALRAAWSDAWALRSAPEQRELLHNGERRVQVDYGGEPWQTPVTVEHELLDYRLRVRTVEHARREARAGPPCTPPDGP
jgi:hypothetical protein